MVGEQKAQKINWYRSPLDRDTLAALNQRSDWKGLRQTLGHLGLLSRGELCHSTVFRSKWLNTFFLYLFSFLGSYNHIFFWASHQEHHKYTLHPPDDLEVVLPIEITLSSFYKSALVNPWGLINRWKGMIRLSRGRLDAGWEQILFPATDPAKQQRLFNWARTSWWWAISC